MSSHVSFLKYLMCRQVSQAACTPHTHKSGMQKPIRQHTTKQTCIQILNSDYLTGVLGLPKKRRGDRIFGSNENFSFTFSNTDGATYVKPWKFLNMITFKEFWKSFLVHLDEREREKKKKKKSRFTRKTWFALSLSVESSGLSTGVWLVNFESNWLTSSADC